MADLQFNQSANGNDLYFGNEADLLFTTAHQGTDLCFGTCPVADVITGNIQAAVGIYVSLTGDYQPPPPVFGSISASIRLSFECQGAYNNGVARYVTQAPTLPIVKMDCSRVHVTNLWGNTWQAKTQPGISYSGAFALSDNIELPWLSTLIIQNNVQIRAQNAQGVTSICSARHQACVPIQRTVATPFADGVLTSREILIPFIFLTKCPISRTNAWRLGINTCSDRRMSSSVGLPASFSRVIPWNKTKHAQFIWPQPVPVSPPPPPPPEWDSSLYFTCWLQTTNLYFGEYICGGQIVIPDQEVYASMHTIIARRVSDLLPIEMLSMKCTIDLASWSWGYSFDLATMADYQAVQATTSGQVLLEVVIDSTYTFRALIESWAIRRSFGSTFYTATGRSEAAVLAVPYGTPRTYTETQQWTAHQLAENELAGSGWAIDWQTIDWLVPAGALSYSQMTSSEVIRHIAEAVGAVCQADMSARVIHVLPRHAITSWQWATSSANIELTESAILEMSRRHEPRPDYNAVYAMGQSEGGVIVRCFRSGTAGDLIAPQSVHPLITDVSAGRERGRIELSRAGTWESVQIAMPLAPPAVPLILPGSLIRVTGSVDTWTGLTTGVALDISRPDIMQSLTIERRISA